MGRFSRFGSKFHNVLCCSSEIKRNGSSMFQNGQNTGLSFEVLKSINPVWGTQRRTSRGNDKPGIDQNILVSVVVADHPEWWLQPSHLN